MIENEGDVYYPMPIYSIRGLLQTNTLWEQLRDTRDYICPNLGCATPSLLRRIWGASSRANGIYTPFYISPDSQREST